MLHKIKNYKKKDNKRLISTEKRENKIRKEKQSVATVNHMDFLVKENKIRWK